MTLACKVKSDLVIMSCNYNRSKDENDRGNKEIDVRRKILISSGLIVCICLIIFFWSEYYRRKDHRHSLLERKGKLIENSITRCENLDNNMKKIEFSLVSSTGVTVNGLIVAPQLPGKYHALFILGGLETGKRAITFLGHLDNTILIGIDYPYTGKRRAYSSIEFIKALPRIHDAVLNTPAAIILTVDYLKHELFKGQIENLTLIGGSLGALFSPVACALDKRFDALVLLFGAADVAELLRVNMIINHYPEFIARISKYLGSVMLAPLETSTYIGDVSPHLLLMVNGYGDKRMPRVLVEKLYQSANQPKELLWLDVSHVHVKDKQFGTRVASEVAFWLKRNNLLSDIAFHFLQDSDSSQTFNRE